MSVPYTHVPFCEKGLIAFCEQQPWFQQQFLLHGGNMQLCASKVNKKAANWRQIFPELIQHIQQFLPNKLLNTYIVSIESIYSSFPQNFFPYYWQWSLACLWKINSRKPLVPPSLQENEDTALEISPITLCVFFSLLLPSLGSSNNNNKKRWLFSKHFFFCFLKSLQFENIYKKKCWEYTVYHVLLTVTFGMDTTSTFPVIDLRVLKFPLKSMEASPGKTKNKIQSRKRSSN